VLSESDRIVGRIIIVSGILSREKVAQYLREKQKSAPAKSFALYLLEKNVITRPQYEAIMTVKRDLEKERAGEERPDAAGSSLFDKVDMLLEKLGIEAESSEDVRAITIERPKFPTSALTEVDYLDEDVSHLRGAGLDMFLEFARSIGASDLHFSSGSPPFVRVHSRFFFLRYPVLSIEEAKFRLTGIMSDEQVRTFLQRKSLDFAYVAEHGRYRANIFLHHRGIGGSFRVIPSKIPSLEELKLPSIVRKFTTYPHGIVLITGPSGCGKTSTLAALIDIINNERHDHIIMIEDPIEFVHKSVNCNVTQREVGRDTADFHTALRAALRENPDVIVVGEMRDLETISMAVTAAETGHLVFGTLHTTNATRTIDRILDVFPPREQPQIRAMLSESLRGVISQRLLPRCDEESLVPAVEVLFNTSAVSNLIREKKTFQIPSVMQTSKKEGMIIMDDSLMELLRRNMISLEVALQNAEEPERFRPSMKPSGGANNAKGG
jgi:twitching motility protein PilT